jgi:hypothetical protein
VEDAFDIRHVLKYPEKPAFINEDVACKAFNENLGAPQLI